MAQRTPANAAVRLAALSPSLGVALLSVGRASSQWPVCASLMAFCAPGAASVDGAGLADCAIARLANARRRAGERSRNMEKGQMLENICPMISATSVIQLQRELNLSGV